MLKDKNDKNKLIKKINGKKVINFQLIYFLMMK
jgi:hypothetical protein